MPETLLSMVIVFLIAGVLIPMMIVLRTQLEDKKRSMHAAEAIYQAARQYKLSGTTSGYWRINGLDYYWKVEEAKICAEYLSVDASRKVKCTESPAG